MWRRWKQRAWKAGSRDVPLRTVPGGVGWQLVQSTGQNPNLLGLHKSIVGDDGKEDNTGIKEKPTGRRNQGAGKLPQRWGLAPLWIFPWWCWTVLVRSEEKPQWRQPLTRLGTRDSEQRVSGAERGSTRRTSLRPLRWPFPTSAPHLPHCNRNTHLPTCSSSDVWRLCT